MMMAEEVVGDKEVRAGEGKLGEGDPKWWELIAGVMPKEGGWKAMEALYQEARRLGLVEGKGGRKEGGLRAKMLQMLEEAAARSAAAGPAAVEGGRGREGGREMGRELELSWNSSIEELLLGTLSPTMAPRALWLLEKIEEEEEEGGREEGLSITSNSGSSSSSSSSSSSIIAAAAAAAAAAAVLVVVSVASTSVVKERKKPTPADYHGAISLLVQGGLVDEGLALLRRLLAQGDEKPLPSSYRVLISGYCRLGRRKSAMYLLQDLRQETGKGGAGKEEDEEEEERECVRLIEEIGRAEGERGRVEGKEDQQQPLQQRGVKEEEKEGREGLPTLGLLRSLTDTYGLAPPLSSYSRVMKGLGEGGREDEALELLKNMRARGIKPDVWC
eukprot:evm.model.NODE_33777_length_6608_cov_28.009382.3